MNRVRIPVHEKISLSENQNLCISSCRPASTRGALRDRHECWKRDAMDAIVSPDERKRARTAKSCGPGAPRLASSRQVMTAGDGGNNAWSPGRARRKLLKPSRRECRCFGWTCGDYACVLLPFAHKAAGAAKHPAFPAPSASRGTKSTQNPGAIAPRECGCASPVASQ